MSKTQTFLNEFVEFIPSRLSRDVIYVSMKYATAVHLCACGCGNKVVTPLTPTDWSLSFDGAGLSLNPSIGNWSFACQSHYWIVNGQVEWAGRWSDDKISLGRERDRTRKTQYFSQPKTDAQQANALTNPAVTPSWLRKAARAIRGLWK